MTLVNTATGEIVEFDAAAAERRAERIVNRLDAIAENYSRVLPMIREAIEKRDDIALGYRSPGDYVSDRFGQSLIGLGVEVRRAVVGELTEAGLSTRAIAPVVGVDNATVHRDRAHVAPATPASSPDEACDETDHGQHFARLNRDGTEEACSHVAALAAPVPTPVTGIDGKTYAAPSPRATPRRALPDVARDAGWDLRKSIERLQRLAEDDRFATNKPQVAPLLRSHPEIHHAAEMAVYYYPSFDSPPSVLTLCWMRFAAIELVDCTEFFMAVANMQTAGVGDPRLALIRRLANARRARERLEASDYLSLIFRAWNATRRGQPLHKLMTESHGGAVAIPRPI